MGGAEMKEPAMAESAERLRRELSDKREPIRRTGGGYLAFEEFPGDLQDSALLADGVDAGHAGEARDASFVALRMLIDEASRLAETIDHLRIRVARVGRWTRAS